MRAAKMDDASTASAVGTCASPLSRAGRAPMKIAVVRAPLAKSFPRSRKLPWMPLKNNVNTPT